MRPLTWEMKSCISTLKFHPFLRKSLHPLRHFFLLIARVYLFPPPPRIATSAIYTDRWTPSPSETSMEIIERSGNFSQRQNKRPRSFRKRGYFGRGNPKYQSLFQVQYFGRWQTRWFLPSKHGVQRTRDVIGQGTLASQSFDGTKPKQYRRIKVSCSRTTPLSS